MSHKEQNAGTVVKSNVELLDPEGVHQRNALVSETQCHVYKCPTKTEDKLVGEEGTLCVGRIIMDHEDVGVIYFFAAAVA